MARTIFAQDPEKYIPALAEALKKIPEFTAPTWASYVKSGTSRERPPANEDFWHTRAASILRRLYIKGVLGVGKLRNKYGSRKDRGGKPDEFRKAGGKIIRVILQQAEAAGLVEKITRLQFGRRLTQTGRDLLDSITVEEKQGLDLTNMQIEKKERKEENEGVEKEKENTDKEEINAEEKMKNEEQNTEEEVAEETDGKQKSKK